MHIMKESLKRKLLKTSQGAITLLLVLSLLPVFSTIALVVESERYQNAARAVEEAMGSGALSTLSQYDSYLLDRFGLLAVKQTEESDFISEQVSKYTKLQKTTDMAGAGIDTMQVEAAGVYPLADISVLRQQIMSYSSVLVPAKLTMELTEIDNLIKEIEKMLGGGITGIFSLISAGSKMLDGEIEMFEALEDAKEQMHKIKNARKQYDADFSEFETAMNDLEQHTSSVRPDETEDPEGAEEWDQKRDSLRETAKNARDTYNKQIKSLQTEIGSLHDKLSSVIKEQEEFHASIAGTAAAAVNAELAIEKDILKDDSEKKSEAQIAKDKQEITEIGNWSAVTNGLKEGAEAASNDVKNILDTLKSAQFDAAILALENNRENLDELDFTEENGYSGSKEEPYHYSSSALDAFQDEGEIIALKSMLEAESIKQQGGWEEFFAFFDVLNELFNTELFYDGELSVRITDDIFNARPSSKNRNLAAYSLNSPYEAADEARAKKILQEIDPNYDPKDPFGLIGRNSSQSKLERLVAVIQDMKTKKEDLDNSSWVLGKLRATKACLDGINEVFTCLNDVVQGLLSSIGEAINEKMLLMGYLSYNLPNRTTFDSGKTLSGFSYSKAALAPSVTGSNVPVLGDIYAAFYPNNNSVFSGAELEYIISGNRSELQNQVSTFMLLFALRLLPDVLPVLSDSTIQNIANAINAIPYVGPILAVIFYVIVIIIEALLDCYVLVNGNEVPLWKSHPYLSGKGAKDLLEVVTDLKLTKEKGESSKTELKDWGDAVLGWDYTQHCMLFLLLFGNETTCLNRLTDLIQMEGRYNGRMSANYANKVLNNYSDFDIEKAYTTIRVQSEGTLQQLLPVPAFGGVSTGIFDSPFQYRRTIYRGY